MTTFRFKECLPHNVFLLQPEQGAQQTLVLEFYGVPAPQVGDGLLIHESLLDTHSAEYTQPYAFELDDVDPQFVKDANDPTHVLLNAQGKIFALRRIYG